MAEGEDAYMLFDYSNHSLMSRVMASMLTGPDITLAEIEFEESLLKSSRVINGATGVFTLQQNFSVTHT